MQMRIKPGSLINPADDEVTGDRRCTIRLEPDDPREAPIEVEFVTRSSDGPVATLKEAGQAITLARAKNLGLYHRIWRA